MSFIKKEFLLLLKNKKLSIALYSLLGVEIILYILAHFWDWHDYSVVRIFNDIIRYAIVVVMAYVIVMSGWKAFKSTSLYDEGQEEELYNIVYYGVWIVLAIILISIIITRC